MSAAVVIMPLMRRRMLYAWLTSWGMDAYKIDYMIRVGVIPSIRPLGQRSRRLYNRDKVAEVLGIEPRIRDDSQHEHHRTK